jgi:hypothetical protein
MHSGCEATVRASIVNVFGVESQGNTLALATNPGYMVVCASADMAGGLPEEVNPYLDFSACRSRSVSS